MSPYAFPVTPIDDVSPYFTHDKEGGLTFTGKTLELRIPASFKKHGSLVIGENVTTYGVMDMIIDEKYQAGLNILGSITIEPSDIGKFTYKGIEYVTVFLTTGKKLMTSTTILKDAHVVYVLWSDFVTDGKIHYMFDYKAMLKLFDHVRELTGEGIGVSRAVYEGIIAHIARTQNDLAKQYRLTDMSQPMKMIALKNISQAPTSTIARINGSYLRSEAMTSALRWQVDDQQPFENILRGVATSTDEDPNTAIL